ncbi:SIS domain-containing protein [Salisediminibacterium beveridgei]|uniref:SIS domain-containing protein n=1 Tax=Salisediminibacterium beveridgei TaxID=632773 RepID=A0A1D7QZS6_9BACI|nr:SIS domain-containing protein [Salisediminibacterium beveridgei]AOM84506.1 hypothetical protein BBEV_3191 [Salisediminibacterium beveridgei]
MAFRYVDEALRRIDGLKERQLPQLTNAANQLIRTLRSDGMIHIFGTGHSHLLAEEAFYRAGGLVSVRPIFIEPLMLHESAWGASALERDPDFAKTFMAAQPIESRDTVVVVSTSGRNPVPVDVANMSHAKGASVIAITSVAYTRSLSSRHGSGQFLADVADVVLNNESDVGDAALTHPKLDTPYCPTSTVIGATLLHAVIGEAIDQLADEAFPLPILKSGNVDGADAHNLALIERYLGRNELLK